MPRAEPAELYDYLKPAEELPPDDDGEPKVIWKKVSEFRGSIAGAHINNNGEVTLSVKVPIEDKYLALPVTDSRSVLLVFAVFAPEQEQAGNLDEEGAYPWPE